MKSNQRGYKVSGSKIAPKDPLVQFVLNELKISRVQYKIDLAIESKAMGYNYKENNPEYALKFVSARMRKLVLRNVKDETADLLKGVNQRRLAKEVYSAYCARDAEHYDSYAY